MAQATVRELKPGGLRPQRYRNAIVPHIYAEPAAEAVAFYARAFGTTELFRIAGRDGKIIHAEIAINGSVTMIGDPNGSHYGDPRMLGGCSASLHIVTDDNEALLTR